MNAWHESLKPRASTRFQLFLAGVMWSTVGSGLLLSGALWIRDEAHPATGLALLLAGILLGALKARYILDKTARKIVTRIAERGEGRCVGGFLSLRSWGLVLGMVLAGRLLRRGLLSPAAAGTLYVAIGAGLLLSSRLAWQAWRLSTRP